MKVTAVRASWLRAVIPPDRAHVSDFGRNDTFNTCLVEVDTDTGLTGLGEAKIGAGNLGNYAATVETIHKELAPVLLGRDPPDITALWEAMYNGTRAHYVQREGRTFPIIGRRGVTISAISGVDIALWDLLGKSLGAPVWRLHEIDFIERSVLGAIPGTGFADWPITYADLERYYTKVEWEIGVSGLAGASPFDPPRTKPYASSGA